MENVRRSFRQLRDIILLNLMQGQKTTNQISNETEINWSTVELHLTYLKGRGLVNEVFTSKYVRIFQLTEKGLEIISKKYPETKMVFKIT